MAQNEMHGRWHQVRRSRGRGCCGFCRIERHFGRVYRLFARFIGPVRTGVRWSQGHGSPFPRDFLDKNGPLSVVVVNHPPPAPNCQSPAVNRQFFVHYAPATDERLYVFSLLATNFTCFMARLLGRRKSASFFFCVKDLLTKAEVGWWRCRVVGLRLEGEGHRAVPFAPRNCSPATTGPSAAPWAFAYGPPSTSGVADWPRAPHSAWPSPTPIPSNEPRAAGPIEHRSTALAPEAPLTSFRPQQTSPSDWALGLEPSLSQTRD